MNRLRSHSHVWMMIVACLTTTIASAQTFRVQCPTTTSLHPGGELPWPYTGPLNASVHYTPSDGPMFVVPIKDNGGGIKCQQISGGDGFATMADGTQTYLFAFGPLSGLKRIREGLPGTGLPSEFNQTGDLDAVGDPLVTDYNGAVGLICDPEGPACTPSDGPFTGHIDPTAAMQIGTMNGNMPAPMMAIDEDDEFFLTLTNVGQIMRPDLFEQHTVHFHGYPNASSFFDGVPDASVAINIGGSFTYYYLAPDAGTYFWHCHITPPEHLQMGMVGQLYVRPRQNRVPPSVHLYDALQAQQADPRTKCGGDILCSAPLPAGGSAGQGPVGGFECGNSCTGDGPRVACTVDTECPVVQSASHCSVTATTTCLTDGDCPVSETCVLAYESCVLDRSTCVSRKMFAYNDGDGSTQYDVEYPIQIHGFDPNFHFVGMTFNPEGFTDMKDKYFLLNGRSYPDTVTEGSMRTQATDGVEHNSQPVPTIINIPKGGKALLRISDLDTTEYQTLASLGIRMHVIGLNARLLRDLDGNDLTYYTNSVTLAGGESADVILDASDESLAGKTFVLYTPNLDHLSNDAENFGGLMTEVRVLNCSVANFDRDAKACRP